MFGLYKKRITLWLLEPINGVKWVMTELYTCVATTLFVVRFNLMFGSWPANYRGRRVCGTVRAHWAVDLSWRTVDHSFDPYANWAIFQPYIFCLGHTWDAASLLMEEEVCQQLEHVFVIPVAQDIEVTQGCIFVSFTLRGRIHCCPLSVCLACITIHHYHTKLDEYFYVIWLWILNFWMSQEWQLPASCTTNYLPELQGQFVKTV